MNANPQMIWIALVAIAVLVVIFAIAAGVRRARTARLREHYGHEYDRTVKTAGSRTAAEEELIDRKREADQFPIRPLSAAERDRYVGDWRRVEQRFVDKPKTAVAEADELIVEVMRTRGYPMADFEKHAALLSVKHPRVIEHYRAGHEAVESVATASTENLRQAMLHYRALFDDLVNDGVDVAREVPVSREVAPASERPVDIVRDEDRPR